MSGVQDTPMTEVDNSDGGVTLNFDVQNAVSDAVATAMNTKSEELKVMMNDKFDELKALISTKQDLMAWLDWWMLGMMLQPKLSWALLSALPDLYALLWLDHWTSLLPEYSLTQVLLIILFLELLLIATILRVQLPLLQCTVPEIQK